MAKTELALQAVATENELDTMPQRLAQALRLAQKPAPYADIATDQGVPVGTIKSRIHRARMHVKMLREEAERREMKYPNGQRMFADDGTMLNERGTRSIFDDVDK